MQILIIEDEKKIAVAVKKGLEEDLYSVDIALDGEEGLYRTSMNDYDCILLDLMIPKINGITLCKKIRVINKNIPILILTAKDALSDKIMGLDAGADDYVTKPFSIEEISARIRALLRRGNKADPVILSVADVKLDPVTKHVTRGSQTLLLTAREYTLLEYFMRNPITILSKSQLLEHVWDYHYEGVSNIVETYVKYLRKKLKISPEAKELIHTFRGLGYTMKE
ncbi:MAG TPA: response regulator transcription factor [Candidatus Sulfotelmatobacter sp.]|jgi:two-component system OmpR family response regulator|nr:response regulator transcription factor [Candidatus Sulfotelmatobacter sp.]